MILSECLIEDTFVSAKVVKKIGFKGWVSLKIEPYYPMIFKTGMRVFILSEGKLIPHLIKNCQFQNDFIKVLFEDIDDEFKTAPILGKWVHLPKILLPPLDFPYFYNYEVENFEIFDANNTKIGTLQGIIDRATQPILSVLSKNENSKEILIPLVYQWIKVLDKKTKKIYMNIPDGLVNLYTNTPLIK